MQSDEQIKAIIRQNPGRELAKMAVRAAGKCGTDRFNRLYRETMAEDLGVRDVELIESNIDLAMKHQRQMDLNRIKNKSFREDARLSNAMVACGEEIRKILDTYDFSKVTIQHEDVDVPTQGIVQLSDLHFNELVETITNVYDFEVAAKRMKLFAIRATELLLFKKVRHVLVANTGDILNSDRRLDEYMNMATNRMNAAMLSAFLIEQFLLDLNRNFNVTYVQVSGNESRVKDEPGYTDVILTDNYDFLIYNILKYGMRTAKGITFLDGDVSEKVVNIMGKNVLITHGEQFSESGLARAVQEVKGKYAQHGITIDFVVFGHVHTAMVHDQWARGGSMVGANTYTERGLQLTTRASQNVHIYYANGEHDSYVISLQNTDGLAGYEIKPALAAYNAKSEKKLHHQQTILQIVV